MISALEKGKADGEKRPSPQVIGISSADIETSAAVCHYMRLKEAIELEFYEAKRNHAALEELKKSKDNEGNYIKLGNLFLKKQKDDLKEKLEDEIRNLELSMMRNIELRTVVYDKVRSGLEKSRHKPTTDSGDESGNENVKRETE